MNGLYIIAIAAALFPVVLLFFYIYRQDKRQPEPIRWLGTGAMLGMFSAAISIFILKYVPYVTEVFPSLSATNTGAILNAFLCASIPEELIKYLMLWMLLKKNPYFDEHLDGVVYATCIGLGFASVENVLCLLRHLDDLGYTASMRALLSVPGHFCYAIVMGYYFSKASINTFDSAYLQRKYKFMAWSVPILLHGIFDSIIMSISFHDEAWYIGSIILLFIFCHLMLKKARKQISHLKQLDQSKLQKEPTGSNS